MSRSILALAVAVLPAAGAAGQTDEPIARDQVLAAARGAVRFYREKVSAEGGYLWRYSADLSRREGEGKAKPTTVWVQPPGTPAVGQAILEAYQATGDKLFLGAARDAAEALRRGQLRSGGWTDRIEFDPQDRRRWRYRIDPPSAKKRNDSSLDDDKTQSALRFLMRLDQATAFRDETVHEVAAFALSGLLRAQYPSGAFPQVWDEPHDPGRHPVRRASYPAQWTRTYTGHREYWYRYTINDGVVSDVIETLFLAHEIYGRAEYRAAAIRAADFLLLAQMPEPQPAWAQQYGFDMHPIWARKFEPPAVTGGESQGVMRTLLDVYRRTNDKKYLDAVASALAYLQRSKLADGRLARFYELKTNRPLYFTRDYKLSYDDDDLPTHYGFKVASGLGKIAAELSRLRAASQPTRPAPRPHVSRAQAAEVRRVIDAMDPRGAWVEDGRLKYHGKTDDTRRIIDSRTFIRHLGVLVRFLAATKP